MSAGRRNQIEDFTLVDYYDESAKEDEKDRKTRKLTRRVNVPDVFYVVKG